MQPTGVVVGLDRDNGSVLKAGRRWDQKARSARHGSVTIRLHKDRSRGCRCYRRKRRLAGWKPARLHLQYSDEKFLLRAPISPTNSWRSMLEITRYRRARLQTSKRCQIVHIPFPASNALSGERVPVAPSDRPWQSASILSRWEPTSRPCGLEKLFDSSPKAYCVADS